MVLNIIVTALVLAITFMHSMFGLYSGLINVACTIFAMVVGLGSFEAVGGWMASTFGMHPSYCEPVALIVMFIVPLSILRFSADQFIRLR
jgi:hypothetical protein